MTEPEKKVDHLEYDINPQLRDEILRYINMPGGDAELKHDLQYHSPDEVDAKNWALIKDQMIHTRVIFPHH
ncbi:hypothetical protein [Levilactobacillus yiduensis]|uniref:hypothetical protein n=1 Tax=Levilactobacillus yiduensis TaxID=2953880 RepID=UPI000EF2F203|nr:hypothetical protein [Levilactobacillus yiduensis]AYM02801.1 hypothetical protein D8911_07265 [Levilactobacillus brevis]